MIDQAALGNAALLRTPIEAELTTCNRLSNSEADKVDVNDGRRSSGDVDDCCIYEVARDISRSLA